MFKYCSLVGKRRSYVERIIRHHEVFLATRMAFNDPFDCRARFSREATDAALRGLVTSELNTRDDRPVAQREAIAERVIAERSAAIAMDDGSPGHKLERRFDRDIGIYCLSACPDDILMWSHYGASHTGVCLRFDRLRPGSLFVGAQPVCYQAEYPVVRPLMDSGDATFRPAFLTKALPWKYEQEWRLVDLGGHGVRRIDARDLTGIILGARITPSDLDAVMGWVADRGPSIDVLQARLGKFRYGLELDSYGPVP